MPDFLNFETLRLKAKPNQYLVAPAGWIDVNVHRESPVYDTAPAELAEKLLRVALAGPRTTILARDDEGLRYELVQRSALFRFPDHISIRVLERGEGKSALAIYSRSRYGHSDLGVNRRRVERWLSKLNLEKQPASTA